MKTRTEIQNRLLHVALFCMMIVSFIMGFFQPDAIHQNFNAHRIHVFLFNLCSGGLLILRYSVPGGKKIVPWLFLIISLIFTISAAMSQYHFAIASAVACAVIVEKVRFARFPFLPLDFFRRDIPVSAKFHHAALLCLSIALFASAFSMAALLCGIALPPKMTVDIFFLGFSFPVSLITMSLLFANIPNSHKKPESIINRFVFWAVNLGVIVFFVFILAERAYPQVIIAASLLVPVGFMFYRFITAYTRDGSFQIIFGGMIFLLISALSGIAYIMAKYLITGTSPHIQKYILEFHRYASLYGWNQAGMLLLLGKTGFHLNRISPMAISLHWTAVLVFAPCAIFCRLWGLPASLLYMAFLAIVFRKSGNDSSANSSEAPFSLR